MLWSRKPLEIIQIFDIVLKFEDRQLHQSRWILKIIQISDTVL